MFYHMMRLQCFTFSWPHSSLVNLVGITFLPSLPFGSGYFKLFFPCFSSYLFLSATRSVPALRSRLRPSDLVSVNCYAFHLRLSLCGSAFLCCEVGNGPLPPSAWIFSSLLSKSLIQPLQSVTPSVIPFLNIIGLLLHWLHLLLPQNLFLLYFQKQKSLFTAVM